MPGDQIELNLPMPVGLMQSHPAVQQNRNQVAVMRRPVVYCLELPLHLGGAEAWQTGVFLPENVELTPHKEEEFLGGVTVFNGTSLTFKGRDRFVEEVAAVEEPLPQRQDRSNMLYRPLQPRKLRQAGHGTVPVTLIPYSAWPIAASHTCKSGFHWLGNGATGSGDAVPGWDRGVEVTPPPSRGVPAQTPIPALWLPLLWGG